MTQRQFYSALKRQGKLTGTIKDALAKWSRRPSQAAKPLTLEQRRQRARVVVPLDSDARWQAMSDAKKLRPRVGNWDTAEATTEPGIVCKIRDCDNGKYSRRCTYTHWTHQPFCTSYAMIGLHGKTITWNFRDDKPRRITAPHGYTWNRDSLGLRLVSNKTGADYHPTTGDLLQGVRFIAARVRENAETRRQLKAKRRHQTEAIRRAEKEGFYLCLKDSIRAGNCGAGTRTWARQNKLDPSKHYPVKVVTAIKDRRDLIAVVVTAALHRHCQEMRQGYSRLSDHR